MPCYHPIKGYKSRNLTENGKRKFVTNAKEGYTDMPISIPCGQCIGCRLDRSRQWAIRCLHEANTYDNNCFITLTYDDKHYPKNGSLNKKHFQDFMKRLREYYPDKKIRYYHCGEYGETTKRPHYHACLFNHDFEDKKCFAFSKVGDHKLYNSAMLDKAWQYKGYAVIGEVTYESAAYVARYILKKHLGKGKAEHYDTYNRRTGEIYAERVPEYTTMSRRPGIGKEWLEKYKKDVYPFDEVVIRGKKMKPPRYYDIMMEEEEKELAIKIKGRREKSALRRSKDNTHERLEQREKVTEARIKMLRRNI